MNRSQREQIGELLLEIAAYITDDEDDASYDHIRLSRLALRYVAGELNSDNVNADYTIEQLKSIAAQLKELEVDNAK